jgi:polyhydroxybutyrate depolymerase
MVLTRLALLLVFALAGSPANAEPCGGTIRCEVEGGYYLVAPPLGWDGFSPVPVVVYFHGWNSSPEGTFRNRAMINAVTRRGAVFVAPYARTGYWRQIGEGRAEPGRVTNWLMSGP